MLNKIITLVFILPALTTIAQSPDVFLIGTGGGMTGTSGLYVSYSLCEPFISMAQNNGIRKVFNNLQKLILQQVTQHLRTTFQSRSILTRYRLSSMRKGISFRIVIK